MNIGQRFSLAWKAPHRIEATITSFEPDYVVVHADHRCLPHRCKLQGLRESLAIHGEMRFRYADFAQLFLPLNDDAIALAGAIT